MIVYPFKAVLPKRKILDAPGSLSAKAKYHYHQCVQKGQFKKSDRAGFYIYEINSQFGVHLGFVGYTDLQEFIGKNIKPHEKTLKQKEKVSKKLLLDRGAMVKPVLVCHLPNKELSELLKAHRDAHAPALTIKLSGASAIHRLWPICDTSTIKQLQHLAGFVDHAYIADGHHRSQVLQQLNATHKKHNLNVSKVCSAYFDFNSVDILDYNRMVDIGERISPAKFFRKLKKKFTVKPRKKPFRADNAHQLSMLLDGKWYELCVKPKVLEKYHHQEVILDHQVFDHEVLNKILHIKNVTEDKSIQYFSGEKPLADIETKLAARPRTAAFFIRPVKIEQLVQLTEKDQMLPPKSTYFVPRLQNGIICDDLIRAQQ